jgi:hypothetical protein
LLHDLLVDVVRASGLLYRALRDRQQRLIRPLHIDLVGVRIGRCDDAAVTPQNERRARMSDREIGEKLGEPRVFDDDCENALAFPVDIDRTGIGDRRTRSNRMDQYVEPTRFVGLRSVAIPFLIGDNVVGVLESPRVKLNVSDHHIIFVDTALDGAVDGRDLHHFQSEIAELMRGEEGCVRPAERDP